MNGGGPSEAGAVGAGPAEMAPLAAACWSTPGGGLGPVALGLVAPVVETVGAALPVSPSSNSMMIRMYLLVQFRTA
jgi:hypothetical protein